MRQAKVQTLLDGQEELYASYFLKNGANGAPAQDEDEDDGIDVDDEEFNIADYISSLPAELKSQFKNNNPQLPEIFFMSRQEKKKYFDDINKRFKKNIGKAPQRSSKTKKKLSFKEQFEIRGFNQKHKVVNIKNAKALS